MLRLYGVSGCGPCQVAKLYLEQKGLELDFADVSRDDGARAKLQ